MQGNNEPKINSKAWNGMQSIQMEGKAVNVSHEKTFDDANMIAALTYMNSLIDEDGEFPDAAHRAANAFGVKQDALELAYDEQFYKGF